MFGKFFIFLIICTKVHSQRQENVRYSDYRFYGGQSIRRQDMVKGRLKTDRVLLIWAVLTALWGGYFCYFFNIYNLTTYSYTALILFWVWSLKDEIPDTYIRRLMSLGGYLLTLLFILRFIKYNLVTPHTFPYRLMWYGYYIPILITPLLSLMISLAIGNKGNKKMPRYLILLKLICALLLIIVLTNDIHWLAIKIWYEGDNEYSRMGLFYFLIIIWYVALTLSSFIIAYRKCIFSSYRKHWKVPLTFEVTGFLLWVWYYLICRGSSPTFNGNRLYNIQEVYVLLFIGFWESLIAIGFIPTVSLAKDRAWISDSIFGAVGNEITEIRSILDRIQSSDDDTFRDGMIRISFIGAYIKRRANLELIPTETGLLSSSELSLAMRETLNYFDFSRISAGFEESGGSVEVPALLISGIFELLKNVIYRTRSACYVKLITGKTDNSTSLNMKIEADMEFDAGNSAEDNLALLADMELFDILGTQLDLREEDDAWAIHLNAAYHGLDRAGIRKLSIHRKTDYTLSQVTSYLSLEKDALATKTHVHDNLGRCLLMTKAWLLNARGISRDMIISQWDNVTAEMTGRYSDPGQSNSKIEPEYFILKAKQMGVDVLISGDIPDEAEYREILDTAFTVHITNILRHTNGTNAYISIARNDDAYVLNFTNDGDNPSEEIVEKGGLKNLRSLTKNVGGTMKIEWKDGFRMILTLPIEDAQMEADK